MIAFARSILSFTHEPDEKAVSVRLNIHPASVIIQVIVFSKTKNNSLTKREKKVRLYQKRIFQ